MVCHKSRKNSTASSDRSINRAELVERCPLTMRHLSRDAATAARVQKSRRATAEWRWRQGTPRACRGHTVRLDNVQRRQPRSPWKQGLTEREWCPLGGGISASHYTVQAGVDSEKKQPGKRPPGPMNEKSTANCRQKSVPNRRETGNKPHEEWRREKL